MKPLIFFLRKSNIGLSPACASVKPFHRGCNELYAKENGMNGKNQM